jgi:hypothetical protein
MRIHLTFRLEPRPPAVTGLFQSAQLPSWNGLPSILSSLAVHMFVLLMIVVAAHQAALMSPRIDITAYHVEFMKLRIPDPLYYRANQPAAKVLRAQKASTARGSAAGKSSPAPLPPPPDSAPPAPVRSGVRIPKGLELPPMPKSVADAPLIMQPPLRIEAPPLTTVVPPLAFWARQNVDIAKPPPTRKLLPT